MLLFTSIMLSKCPMTGGCQEGSIIQPLEYFFYILTFDIFDFVIET
jgi:hypothetical protein